MGAGKEKPIIDTGDLIADVRESLFTWVTNEIVVTMF